MSIRECVAAFAMVLFAGCGQVRDQAQAPTSPRSPVVGARTPSVPPRTDQVRNAKASISSADANASRYLSRVDELLVRYETISEELVAESERGRLSSGDQIGEQIQRMEAIFERLIKLGKEMSGLAGARQNVMPLQKSVRELGDRLQRVSRKSVAALRSADEDGMREAVLSKLELNYSVRQSQALLRQYKKSSSPQSVTKQTKSAPRNVRLDTQQEYNVALCPSKEDMISLLAAPKEDDGNLNAHKCYELFRNNLRLFYVDNGTKAVVTEVDAPNGLVNATIQSGRRSGLSGWTVLQYARNK